VETWATITIAGIRPHYGSAQAIRMLSVEDQLVFRQGLATIVCAERDTLTMPLRPSRQSSWCGRT
jgi:hypothetical protein